MLYSHYILNVHKNLAAIFINLKENVMSELSEKPDDLVFAEHTNMNDLCNHDMQSATERPTLVVDTSASRSLSFLSGLLLIIAMIMFVAGIILISEDKQQLTFWGLVLIGGTILPLICRIFVKSKISITKSFEYYNAQVEDKFNIKRE